MEIASQGSDGILHRSNIEAGLSEKDSLALEVSTKPASNGLPSENQERKKLRIPSAKTIKVTVFVLSVIAVIIAAILTKDKPDEFVRSPADNVFEKDDPTDTPSVTSPQDTPSVTSPQETPSVTSPPGTSRLEVLRQILIPVSGVEPLMDPTTPQYAALEWLADDDPANLDLDKTHFKLISDRYKLALLYFATSGSGWRRQHNFLSASSFCDWNDGGAGSAFEGVGCENDEVVEIILDMNLLRGRIPTEIALFNLKAFGLGSNSIEGTIPSELGRMGSLTRLSLSGNFLTGTLCSELGNLSKLEGLFLYNNQLTGSIPSSFQALTDLQLVFLEGTALKGNVDTTLCARRKAYRYFYANCGDSEVTCPCCTHCCKANGAGCKGMS